MELIVENTNGISVITLVSDVLDAENSKDFKREMTPLLQPGARMVLDIGQLKFIDSSGLGSLLSCLRQLNASNGDLKLCGMGKPVRALFELVRMHRIFEIFNTRDEAVNSYA